MNYRELVEYFFQDLLNRLYPIRMGKVQAEQQDYAAIKPLLVEIMKSNVDSTKLSYDEIAEAFVEFLPHLKMSLSKDIDAINNGDPAAVNEAEIIIAYPGFYAIAAYRIAHFLLHQGIPLIPRIITEHAHSYTGIDIHPGAQIGEHFCIDHGTGLVIGETCVIGNHVKVYQGVTLGALSINKKKIEGQRHPTIEDHVIIYAQATILGGNTVIGRESIIGGNVWLTKSVAPNSKVYYKGSEENQLHIESNRFLKNQNV